VGKRNVKECFARQKTTFMPGGILSGMSQIPAFYPGECGSSVVGLSFAFALLIVLSVVVWLGCDT